MENISQMSLLEVAVMLMEQKRGSQSIRTLIKEVFEIKGIEDEDGTLSAQLYLDITTSSKFVYMGNEEWDLKSRQSLDEYDKDGSAFNNKEDLEDLDDEEETLSKDDFEDDDLVDDEDDYLDDEDEEDDYYLDDEDDEDDEEDDDEYDDEEDSIIDDDLVERYDEDDFNEDKYNDLMDDYEDMYEE